MTLGRLSSGSWTSILDRGRQKVEAYESLEERWGLTGRWSERFCPLFTPSRALPGGSIPIGSSHFVTRSYDFAARILDLLLDWVTQAFPLPRHTIFHHPRGPPPSTPRPEVDTLILHLPRRLADLVLQALSLLQQHQMAANCSPKALKIAGIRPRRS